MAAASTAGGGQASRIDGEIQTVLNRFLLFGPGHGAERATCTADLTRIAKGDDLIFHGSKLITSSTLSLIGSTLCDVIASCSSKDTDLSWSDAGPMLEAVLLLLANCCLTDDLRLHSTLLALTPPRNPVAKKAANEELAEEAEKAEGRDENYFAKMIVMLFNAGCGGDGKTPVVDPKAPIAVNTNTLASKTAAAGGVKKKEEQPPAYVPLTTGSMEAVLFAALDLIATLSSNSSEVRAVFGSAGIHEVILHALKAYPTQLDVLFGGTMTLSTLTTADTLNGKRLVQSGGLQTLVDVNRRCFLNRARFAAGPPKPELSEILAKKPGDKQQQGGGGGESEEMSAEERKEMGLSIEKYCQLTLMNIMKVPFDLVDEALGKVNYGKFGSCVAMDELKWNLTKERKRCNKLLLEYRRQKAATTTE